MKNKNLLNWLWTDSHEKQSPQRFARYAAMLIMLLTLSVGQMWADEPNKNVHWQGYVWFRVPDNWDLTNYSHVQLAVARTTSIESTYIDYFGQMTRVGTTRLYFLHLNADHSKWNQNEYILFTANDHNYGTGTFNITENHYYTTPTTYVCNNPAGCYLFTPNSEDNGASVTGSYDTSRNNVAKKDQKVYLYTNGSESKTGGSVKIDGIYFTDDTNTGTSSVTNGSGTSATYGNVVGANVTLTATPASGYTFVGWFESASGGSAISTNNPYTYRCKGAKTLYARFETRYSVTVNAGSNGTITTPAGGSGRTVTAGYYTSAAIAASANPGYYFTSWSRNNSNVTIANSSSASTSVTATGTATVTANFAQKYVLRGSINDGGNTPGGMPGWSATTNTHLSIDGNVMTFTATLTDAKTQYKCMIYDVQNSSYKGQTGTGAIGDNTAWTLNGTKDVYFTTTAPGTYTFTYNVSNGSFKVLYPTSHTVTYNNYSGKGSVSATNGGYSIGTSPGYAVSGTNVIMTATPETGYSFSKWVDGSGTQISTSNPYTISSINANKTVRPVFTPNVYTLTFHLNGGDSWGDLGSATNSAGTVTMSVTYDQVLNGLTMPHAIKNAYHFDRWSVSNVYGYQHIWRYDYSVEPRIYHWYEYAGYVTKVGDNYIWKKDADVDLYAYYDAPELRNLSFSPDYVVPEGDVTAKITFSPVMGEPEGEYILCYKLTTAAGVALQAQPEWRDKDDAAHTVSFTVPASPGEYSLGIKLFPGSSATWESAGQSFYFDGKCTGVYSSYKFEVEAMNAVTVSYMSGTAELRPSITAYATYSNPATLTAPDIPGMEFNQWEFTGSAYLKTGYEATNKTVEVRATGTGSAIATYNQGSLFFKDTKGWGEVYVYFYNSASGYWHTESNKPEGTGSKSDDPTYGSHFISGPHAMTLLDGTDDVYYYDGDAPAYAAVAFTKEEMAGYQFFAGTSVPDSDPDPCHVVYVNAFDANKPMIVPIGNGALWNQKYARYYAHDLAPLLPDWGYDLRGDNDIIGWSPETDADKHKMKAAKLGDLSFSTDIYFDNVYASKAWKIYNGNKGYGRSDGQTLTYTSQTSNPLANHDDSGWNLNVRTNIAGNYTFTLNFGTDCTEDTYSGAKVSDANGLMGHMTVKVTYPVDPGDFRLVYIGGAKPHPGNVIKKRANGEDIVSMYVAAGQSGSLKVQPCSAASASSVTWTGLGSCSAPTYADGINFASILSEGGAGTYNFTITQDENKVAKITNVEKYTGRFYVRTNCVDDKWNYKLSPDKHAMTYSEWSEKKMEDTDMRFSHYYVDDLHGTSGSPINIRFTVATDYSEAICDTVFEGDADGKWKDYIHSESLQRTANVRFTYDQNRNKIWRAYTEGPENDNYMVLRSNGTNVFVVDGLGEKGAASAAVKFTDLNNWVYQADVFANVNTYIKLTAQIDGSTQYLRGNTTDEDFDEDDAEMLIGGSGSGLSAQHMRITYDFKTDRMTTSWIPSSAVSGTLDIHADIMLLRTHQDGASSITFNTDGKLTDVKTAYGVMEFQKDYINDYSLSRYERNLYWISFPFDVNLSDVFGFGNYGEHWIIEYYDGKGRAEKGYWAESEPNWKFVTEEVKDEFVLKANEGYILALALSNMTEYSDIWANSVTSVYLYFPSANEIGNLSNVSSVTVKMDTVGYKCKITRDNRNIKDSYWRCIGVPSYAQSTRTDLPTSAPANWETKVPYVYTWNSTNNTLAITSSSSVTFEAMHSYLIQYPDDKMVWEDVTNVPSGVVRRRVEGNKASFYEWNLNLLNNGQHIDHTYVRLSNDENVTDGYDFGNDLSKEFNSGSNIYTFVDDVEVAGNVKPIRTETTIVPVGVKIATTGEYTFSMPEGTNGVGVVLVDNISGARTNLSLTGYTINLEAGQYDGRFLLEISPIAQTPTDMEKVQGDDIQTNVRKVMVDGILYIVKDGVIYDACGNRVK